MRTRAVLAIAALLFAAVFVARTDTARAQATDHGSWTIPPDAADTKNPVAGDAQAIAGGKQLFEKNCRRCHGPGGKGDGPDADPDNQQDMDLTVARRAARNPDGVVFYKVWNGRARPKMPAFKNDLTEDQVWQIVSFVQTLREKQ